MTSWHDSHLTAPKYGYDIVVATTQASINMTLKYFLQALKEPVVECYFVADANGNPVPIEPKEFLKRAQNLDPFTVPPDLGESDPRVQQLKNARFMACFRAQIGLPGGNDPGDIVVLGGHTSQVTFNMVCSEFTIVSLQLNGYATTKTIRVSQDPDHPWIFSSKVDLRLDPVDKGAYNELPKDVQAAIKNLDENAFSVQQLLFDLTNARLSSTPIIQGVPEGSNEEVLLDKYFKGIYFQTLRKKGDPVLGNTITSNLHQASSLHMTDINLHTQTYMPRVTTPELDVLNYLCAVDGKPLPRVADFDWNWVTPEEVADHHGIIAVNRNTFANWFRNQLFDHVKWNCWAFDCSAWYDAAKLMVMFKITPRGGQTPTDDNPQPTGPDVVKYTYSHSSWDKSGVGGALGKIRVDSSYSLTVRFEGTAITISQHILAVMDVEVCSSGSGPVRVVDKTIVDTYSMGIAGDTLVFEKTSKPENKSKISHIDGFRDLFTGYNDLVDTFKTAIDGIATTNFATIPVAQLQNFVFPGGRTFAFKKAAFSDHQDLVSLITYADPRTE